MAWTLVGRVEQLEHLRRTIRGGSSGVVMITGEPGAGRSTVLARTLEFADPKRDMIRWLKPAGDKPFAALHKSFPGTLPTSMTTSAAALAITKSANGRRLVIAADDAHLIDRDSLLVAREISREGLALLLATCPKTARTPGAPDPSDLLRYEKGIQLLSIRSLGIGEVAAVLAAMLEGPVALSMAEAIHAVTGGNPRLLRILATEMPMADCMVRRNGLWHLGAAGTDPSVGRHGGRSSALDVTRISGAAWNAWRELACGRADQLCRLALLRDMREEVAPIWATLLLLRGNAMEAAAFIGSLPDERVVTVPRLSLVMALTLAIGLGRTEEASEFLARAADRSECRSLLLAYRGWIFAVTGRSAQAAAELRAIQRTDLATAMFIHAARGEIARAAGYPNEAVFHFRRALATAETGSDDCPWMRPFLTASLIDSMLLSGRVKDATSIAQHFHAGAPSSGWELAVAMEALVATATGERSSAATATGERSSQASA